MALPLETLIEAVRRRDSDAVFYFCGDYCDRGPETHTVVDQLLELAAVDRAFFVRGNHDEIFDLVLNRQGFASGADVGAEVSKEAIREAATLFLGEGLLETLVSYGADMNELGKARGERKAIDDWLAAAVSNVPVPHRRFFRGLPAVVETDDFAVVHACWPPDYVDESGAMNGRCARDEQLRHDVIWARYTSSQITSEKQWNRVIYVGHTPTMTYYSPPKLLGRRPKLLDRPGDVIFGNQLVLCDTGCFAPDGRLSAVCHETSDVIQVHRTGDLLD